MSVKHYLRGEEGTYYEDLWPLVKFLPAYALPPGLPSLLPDIEEEIDSDPVTFSLQQPILSASAPHLPLPNVTGVKKRPSNITIASPISPQQNARTRRASLAPGSASRPLNSVFPEDPPLLPSRLPPKFSYFDVFPLSLLVKFLTKRGKEIKGRKAARVRARRGRGKRGSIVSYNVPLEITLYIVSGTVSIGPSKNWINFSKSSYIAALQRRKSIDVPTTSTSFFPTPLRRGGIDVFFLTSHYSIPLDLLTTSLNGLVDALTGLERILTTPIPFS